MLTVEILRANTALTGLSDEQLTAIATMSKNDENTVVGNRIGELHSRYDADILSLTGEAKKEGEKTYDYMKRSFGIVKAAAAKAETYEKEVKQLKADKADLEKKLADGSADETLKQKLKDTEHRLSQLQTQYETDKTKFEADKKDYENKIKSIHVDHAFAQAIAGLKFKDGVDENVKKVLIENAKQQVLAKGTPDFVDVNGVSTLIFRDSNGMPLNNPANSLAPYTVTEMLQGVDALKAILGTSKAGGGTGPIPPSPTVGPDISGAKNQVEADDIIADYLIKQKGLTRYSAEFVTELSKLRADLGVDKLKVR